MKEKTEFRRLYYPRYRSTSWSMKLIVIEYGRVMRRAFILEEAIHVRNSDLNMDGSFFFQVSNYKCSRANERFF